MNSKRVEIDSEGKDLSVAIKGSITFDLTKEQIERASRWHIGGAVTLVLKDHLIEDKQVEVLNVRGKNYTKTDILDMITELGREKSPNIAEDLENI